MVKQKSSYEKISPTAKLVAWLRTFTNIPFAKELAEESRSEETFKELVDDMGGLIISFTPFFEARYKATDEILKQHNIKQVLEIASGLSPRCLAMTESPNVIYVATDLPQILEQERAIIEKITAGANIYRPNIHFQTVDALDRESLLAAANYFRPSEPIAIVTEGLLNYLNREEKGIVARNILELTKRNSGVWITPDVTTKQTMERILEANGNLRKVASHIYGITERNMENNAFADEYDMQQFFNESGFAIEEYQHSNTIESLSSIKLLGINRENALRMLQGRKTLILTPQDK
ncbi:MAG TPA: class I SAM-dependent methyltransferase [Candidatus Nanoarchaeia archaeon]|nr:class I SAM-dependent methyltransferase [Candidatus Nanoarchaeia archaeon]